MAQGIYKKLLTKKIRKGNKGFPIATIAFYGPTNAIASKVVCAIIAYDGAEPEPLEKWFSKFDVRKSAKVSREMLAFIDEHNAKSVYMAEEIMGCPHEEGIDYPAEQFCPECNYWRNRDRFSQELVH